MMSAVPVASVSIAELRSPFTCHPLDGISCKNLFDRHAFVFRVFNYKYFITYTSFTHIAPSATIIANLIGLCSKSRHD